MRLLLKLLAVILAVIFAASSFCVGIYALEYVTAGTEGETPASESYKKSKYYTYLTDVTLTGDNPTDVIAIALSQLGYRESNSVDDLGGLTGGDGNFTEYNYNFGDFSSGYGYHWCAAFVSFCLLQSHTHNLNKLKDWCRDHSGDDKYIWRELGCEKWRVALKSMGYFRTSVAHQATNSQGLKDTYVAEYTPTSGDLIFFTENPFKTASHIGIVLYTEGDKIYTIEGNTDSQDQLQSDGDGVYIKSYDINDSHITGYADMPYKTLDSVQKIDYSGKNPTTGAYMSTVDIPLYETKDAAIAGNSKVAKNTVPTFTMLSVSRIYEDGLFYVQTVIGGEKVTGYISGKGQTIQLSTASVDLTVPENDGSAPKQETHGCGSSLSGLTILPLVLTAFTAYAFINKKRKQAKT